MAFHTARASERGAILPHRGHRAMSGDMYGCQEGGQGGGQVHPFSAAAVPNHHKLSGSRQQRECIAREFRSSEVGLPGLTSRCPQAGPLWRLWGRVCFPVFSSLERPPAFLGVRPSLPPRSQQWWVRSSSHWPLSGSLSLFGLLLPLMG